MPVKGVGVVVVVTVTVGVGEVVPVTKGTVVGVDEDVVGPVKVVVVPLGFFGLVCVVDEDVVDGVDVITPKSMSLRCSPSSR